MTTEKPTLSSIKKIRDLDGIRLTMAHVFQDAQLSLSGHKKLVVVLRNIHKRALSLNQEEGFTLLFVKLLNKILSLKKGEQVADRIAKFCSLFVSTLCKEEASTKQEGDDNLMERDDSDNDEEEDTPASRFIDYILRHLLRGIQAKDKNVRYRVVQLLAYIVNYIGEIDEELFKALHWSLNRRLFDKEANVRIQAVVAIASFQYISLDDEPEAETGLNKASQSLIYAIQNDDSAEVRRAALLNLKKSESTIKYLLERARDVNSINRRLVYSRIMRELGDFREIDYPLRDKLLHWGLHDRDESVRKAAIKMVSSTWYEYVNNDVLELIENLRVNDSDIADTAMQIFYESKEDSLQLIEISPVYWKELSVERAFLIRTFFEFCNDKSLYDLIDKCFPDSVELSDTLTKYFHLRKHMLESNSELVESYETYISSLKAKDAEIQKLLIEEHDLLDVSKKNSSKEKNKRIAEAKLVKEQIRLASNEKGQFVDQYKNLNEDYLLFHDQMKDLEFVILQLLLISKDYDLSDEVGRRKMLIVIRSSLTNDELPDKLIEMSLKVLQKISINERDFSAMCTEIITDIRDSYMDENDEDTFHSAISGFRNSESESDAESDNLSETEAAEGDSIRAVKDKSNGEVEADDADKVSSLKKKRLQLKQPPDNIVVQSLLITQHLLELTTESLDNNYSLGSLIESLVRPAVLRNEQPIIRLLGMRCLGLFSLLDKQLAIENLYLFGIAATKADEELRTVCVKIIVDILATHGVSILDIDGGVDSLSLARLFYKMLRVFEMPNLQCVVAEGLCKLFLADILTNFGRNDARNRQEYNEDENAEGDKSDEKLNEEDQEKQLFETLVLTYFHPYNANNHALRQILAFCIPVYAFSHPSHQNKVASISGDCFYRMFRDDGEFSKFDNVASPSTILQQLIHWCDPNNLVNTESSQIKHSPAPFWQAMGFLQVIEQDTPKNIKKITINNLSKLYITEDLGVNVLEGLKNAVEDTKSVIEANQHDPDFIFDSVTEKNFEKFRQAIADLVDKAKRKLSELKSESFNESAVLSSSVRSRQNSLLQRDVSASPVKPESSKNFANGISSDQAEQVYQVDQDETPSPENKNDVEISLKQIDKDLEQEENVYYDVSMEDI